MLRCWQICNAASKAASLHVAAVYCRVMSRMQTLSSVAGGQVNMTFEHEEYSYSILGIESWVTVWVGQGWQGSSSARVRLPASAARQAQAEQQHQHHAASRHHQGPHRHLQKSPQQRCKLTRLVDASRELRAHGPSHHAQTSQVSTISRHSRRVLLDRQLRWPGQRSAKRRGNACAWSGSGSGSGSGMD